MFLYQSVCKKVQIKYEIDKQIAKVSISNDYIRIRSVLQNLIGSAINLTYEGTIYIIAKHSEKNSIEIFVENSG